MPHLHETVRLEGGIELRAKAGGGRVQPDPASARQWAAKGIETKPNKTARAQLETRPAGSFTPEPPFILPDEQVPAATRALVATVLHAAAKHLWTRIPPVQFVGQFPGAPTLKGACTPDGTVQLRADLTGADLVEVIAHEVAHAQVVHVYGAASKAVAAAESIERQRNEQYAVDYGRLVRRAWEYNEQYGAGLDFGYALSREPRPEPRYM